MRRFFSYIMIFAMLSTLLLGCGSQTPSVSSSSNEQPSKAEGAVLGRVEQSKVLKVGFEGTYPPFNYQDKNSEFTGFDVDISNEIAKRLGVKTEFLATKWDSLIGGIQANKFDIIIAQMAITDERKQQVDFTNPYVTSGAVLITRQNTNDIANLADLKGKKVGIVPGTVFEKIARGVQGADVHNYQNAQEMFLDLKNNRIDVVIDDMLVAGYDIKESKLPFKVASGLVSKYDIGMAVNKNNPDFVAKVNDALASMKKDGTYDQLFTKWFGLKPVE